MKKVILSYEHYLIWKRNRFDIRTLKDLLHLYYDVDIKQIDDIDHNYGRTIEIWFEEGMNKNE